MKKGKKGEYRSALHPVLPADEQVASILSDGEQRFETSLTREERARLAKMRKRDARRKRRAKEKWNAVKDSRLSIYIPVPLQEAIRKIAQKEGTSISQVIKFFLYDALARYAQGEIGFWGHKHPSKSPRYQWNLVHPDEVEQIESRKIEKNR